VAVTTRGPLVGEAEIRFSFADPGRALAGVALAHELRRPRRARFLRRPGGRAWELRFPRPEADRLEYLLELTRRGGSVELVSDPENPLRARGPLGDKSVVELPGYEPPDWIADDESPPGETRALALRSRRLRGALPALLWASADADPEEPLPLLVVHDGPEFAKYSELTRLLDHLVAFGELPPLRAALLPPSDRNETYAASPAYGRTLVKELLPAVLAAAPTPDERRLRVGVGASLGALALLHAHWAHPGAFGGLFLQSGSYFRRRSDPQESGFPRFHRISEFVGRVLDSPDGPEPLPVTLTCGTAEENLDNNRAVAAALAGRGWDVRLVENRDAHNWIGWRDALHPHLLDLLQRAWT
jgi:enterochelin esterase-like enzyme